MPSLGDEKNAGKITRDLKDGKKDKIHSGEHIQILAILV
jgi:hypothetical protein